MSNTSIRPIPTLRGIFTVPRVTPSRNFLKENKQTLRSLEKATADKLAAKEPVRPKWMPPLRRAASESHEPKRCQADNTSLATHKESETGMLRSNCNTRSQHSLHSRITGEPSEPYEPSDKRGLHKVHIAPETEQLSERCQSCGTERSSTSIGIQTEDIMDELYLTNALKKCSFDGKSMLSEGRNLCIDTGDDDYDANYRGYGQYDDEDQPHSGRLNPKHGLIDIDDNEAMPMTELHNLGRHHNDDEGPLSARSRATIGSMASNVTSKSKRREHKLGSRDDLRLPRYLEKEKRDKAEAIGRQEARDPDCPRGHVLLSESERQATLADAKHRFEMLIKELNHMPMTADTQRVRTRKAEIEKELTLIEDDIRIFSKEKVYVKANKSRNL